MIAAIALYIVLAISYIASKASLQYMQPLLLTSIRLTFAGATMLSYVWLHQRQKWQLKPADRLLFLGVVLFHGYFSYVLYFLALDLMSAAKTALLSNLAPFFSAFFAYFFVQQTMTKRKWLGLVIGFLGTLPTIIVHNGPNVLGYFSWGEMFIIASVASASFGWCLVYILTSRRSYSPLMVNGIGMLGGGLLAFISSLVIEGGIFSRLAHFYDLLNVIPGTTLPVIVLPAMYILIGLISANFIFYNLYPLLLRRYSLVYLSLAGFITPLFTALLAKVFLQEALPRYFFLSLTILSIGLYIFNQEESKKK